MPTYAKLSVRTLLAMLIVALAPYAIRAEIKPDFLMDTNPDCKTLPPVPASMQRYVELWITALERPEVDYQRMSAESLAQVSQLNAPGIDKAIPRLEKIVTDESSHPVARFAAARALIAMGSRNSAEKLFQASQTHGSDLRQLIEPALANWDFGPIKAIWKNRLETPDKWPRDFTLATRGIGKVRDGSTLPTLRSIVFNLILSPDVRLESASAMGQLSQTGLEEDADRISHEKRTNPFVNRHCAIRLLAQHDSEAARRLLTELAVDAEPSIAAAALERLNAIDPALVLPLAEQGLKNLDANVRRQAAHAYIILPTPDRIKSLSVLLDDPFPSLRRHVCSSLNDLAKRPELDASIRSCAMEALHGEGWRGQEQAGLLLGQLEHQPAANRLVALLESTRKEVMVSSAWALRKIADRATVAAIIDKIERQTKIRKMNPTVALDHQVAHLFESLGKMGIKGAEPLMRQYIPKDFAMGERSRGAAIWALGWLHEDVPDNALAQQLMDRVNDNGIPPEMMGVKHQSIITIARMKSVSFAAEIREAIATSTPNERLALARRWAVQHLTGEELPGPQGDIVGASGWFLEPLQSSGKE